MVTFRLYSRIYTFSKKDIVSLYDLSCDGDTFLTGCTSIPAALEHLLPKMAEGDTLVTETGLYMSKEMVRLAVEENRIEALMKM